MATDIERRRNNPGIKNFGELIRTAMALDMKKAEEAREEARTGRTAARTAVYSKYPQLAAQELGMDTGTLPGAPTPPAGFAPSRFTVDESGQTQTIYEPPGANAPGPTWNQQQQVESLKTGLRMGKIVIGKEFGEPSVYEAKTMEDALKAIQEAGYDPALFSEELKLYDVVEQRMIRVGRTPRIMQKLRDGRVIWQDTKETVK